MKKQAFNHILFIMLTAVMCFAFTGYALISQYQVKNDISVNLTEKDSEANEKPVSELNFTYFHQSLVSDWISFSFISSAFHHPNDQLPDFSYAPNTPPPNLA